MKWSVDSIPNMDGKNVIITGANSGLGFETSKVLSSKGANIIMACRNLKKAESAKKLILHENPDANLMLNKLDLGSLNSIHSFAESIELDKIDILYNNAGIMAIPKNITEDGFEMQFGVNHLGHFALTGLLLDKILTAENSRIVTLSSLFHVMGKINFEDLMYERRRYWNYGAYGQSKLANLLFTYELQKKLNEKKSNTIAVSAHPGWATTHLQTKGSIMSNKKFGEKVGNAMNFVFGYSAYKGSLPQLKAGTDENAKGGEFYGPLLWNYLWPHKPKKVWSKKAARNDIVSEKLWKISEELTGISYNFS